MNFHKARFASFALKSRTLLNLSVRHTSSVNHWNNGSIKSPKLMETLNSTYGKPFDYLSITYHFFFQVELQFYFISISCKNDNYC